MQSYYNIIRAFIDTYINNEVRETERRFFPFDKSEIKTSAILPLYMSSTVYGEKKKWKIIFFATYSISFLPVILRLKFYLENSF